MMLPQDPSTNAHRAASGRAAARKQLSDSAVDRRVLWNQLPEFGKRLPPQACTSPPQLIETQSGVRGVSPLNTELGVRSVAPL